MTKPEVRAALLRLGQAVMMELAGRVVPLQANWAILNSLPQLQQPKYGLDDLLGELISQGQDPAAVFAQLLSPSSALMIRRWWQRPSAPWTEAMSALPSVDEVYRSTQQAIEEWFMAGLAQPNYLPRRVIASTPGVGKTEALARVLSERMQIWQGSAQADLANQLQQEILALETSQSSAQDYARLEHLRKKRDALTQLYQDTLGGSLLVLFPNREALAQFQNRLLLLNGGTLPNWLALRTGREVPNPELTNREQMGGDSLVCAHHQPVSLVGTQRHSPSALACSHCFWGQEGRCGFLDSIKAAHLAPVVLATADAVLNASNELGQFTQVVIDEGLPHHLYEAVEIGQHLPQLLQNLRTGIELRLWDELYTTDILKQLLAVIGELETARMRFRQATPEELSQQGKQVTAWMDRERIKAWLVALEHLPLKPLRWDMDKLELVAASHYPWERPRYARGSQGLFLHQESYGEEQDLAFDTLPLRATDALLEELYQAIDQGLAGSNLTFEATKSDAIAIHLYRPYHHLIDLLTKCRVLNLDATPNETLLQAFLPDIQIQRYDAALNVEIFQILSAPMGKASEEQLKCIIPALEVLGQQQPVLLITHKAGVDYLEKQSQPLPNLIQVRGADGKSHRAGWFGYHDRAFDDPLMKTAKTLVLAGGYTPNIGHLERLARMLERYLAVKKRSLSQAQTQPYRIHSYGPQEYQLVEACQDALLDDLIYQERTAALLQALNRPRPARSKHKLQVILYRADPVPAPYNRYVQVLGSIEELFSVSLPMRNKANAVRLLAAWEKHGAVILDYFIEHWVLPTAREVQRLAGGSRGRAGSITRAMAWFSSQVLPQLQQQQPLTRDHPAFQKALARAAQVYFDVTPVLPPLPINEEAMVYYWQSRYRYGNASERLVTWLCTRHLSSELQAALESIQPIQEVFTSLRSQRQVSRPPWHKGRRASP